MAENERDLGHFLKGFVIGGFLGALVGILFAPKSGKELRSDIKEKGGDVLRCKGNLCRCRYESKRDH